MKKTILILILGAIFVACSPEKRYAKELEEIDNYQKSLDSLADSYENIKFDSLIAIQKVAFESEKMIKKYYVADTISIDFAQRLQFIKSVRKSLSNIKISKEALKNELEALKLQFKNLESDTKNGILTSEQIKTYLAEEAKAFENLSENISNLLTNQNEQLKDFYYSYPIIEDYVEKIKPKEDKE